jgi:regulator of cell morphogenesis and NO signaling
MKFSMNQMIGEVVAADYRTASVFKRFGIDFCCNGNRSIAEAGQKIDIAPEEILLELEKEVSQGKSTNLDFRVWPLDLLADYIEKKHHRYVERRIKEIKPFLTKVIAVHGKSHPELIEIGQLFNDSAIELAAHMKKEETILFPYIRKLIQCKIDSTEPGDFSFGTVQNPIEMMHHEHDVEGARFRKISELTTQYTPPFDACSSYKVTFAMLQEFEEDLHLHIHLENNILFPGAIELERELTSSPASCSI